MKVDAVRRVFYLARHGQTEANAAGRYQGVLDTPLTARGAEQARRLGTALRSEGLDAAWTSPLGRTRETLRLALEAADASRLEPVVVPELREIHHGDWQGRTIEEVEHTWPEEHRAWRTAPHQVTMPGAGGESLADVRARAVAAFREHAAGTGAERVLIVTHDVVLRLLLADALDAPSSSLWALRQDSCCLNVVELLADGSLRVAAMNLTAHLGGETLVGGYRNL